MRFDTVNAHADVGFADAERLCHFLVAEAIEQEHRQAPTISLRRVSSMPRHLAMKNPRVVNGEEVADIEIHSSALRGIEIPEEWVSRANDELPVVMIAVAFAEGVTRISGAAELRVKESDRIEAMVGGLRGIGVDATRPPDGAIIQLTGPRATRDNADGEIERCKSAQSHNEPVKVLVHRLRLRRAVIAAQFPTDPAPRAAYGVAAFAHDSTQAWLGVAPFSLSVAKEGSRRR